MKLWLLVLICSLSIRTLAKDSCRVVKECIICSPIKEADLGAFTCDLMLSTDIHSDSVYIKNVRI